MTLNDALPRPWRLPPNRVSRFYRGGLLLERFRNAPEPADSTTPEDWVGSATRSWTPPGTPPVGEGLAEAEIDGRRHRIADLLAADPAAVAGADLVAAAGAPTLGVLVKLLDAAIRLPVHAHPTRAFARDRLASFFGKAEAWIVTDTRALDADGPAVWIGFRREVGRDELIERIEAQDSEGLLAAMHHRPTRPGDVWFIPPGTPHAIGAGVFMVEVQEPSDFSIVAETRGVPIEAADAHLRLGWEVTVDAFDREGHDEAWLDALRHAGRRSATDGPGWRSEPLMDVAADPFFRAERLTVQGLAEGVFGRPSYVVGVVTGGLGRIRAGSGELEVRAGDTFALPAAVLPELEIRADERLELIACRPPDPADLT